MLRLNPEVQGWQAVVGAEHSPCLSCTVQPPDSPTLPRRLREAWAMAQLSAFLQRAGVWFLASLSEAGSPGRAPRRSSDSNGQRPRLRRSPHLYTQHPANRQFQTAQPSPARTPLPSSYWSLVKGRNNVIGFVISLPLALQDLGGSWRRPPLSIRGWRALIG